MLLWRLFESTVVAVWLAANLFVFGPHATHARNPDMFRLTFSTWVLQYYALPAAQLVAALVAMALLLPTQALFVAYLVLLFAVALLAWVQGSFLVWDYGVFDGNNIDFATHQLKGVGEAVLWGLVIVLLLRARRRLHPHVVWIAGGLCLLQGLAMPFGEAPPPRRPVAAAKPPKAAPTNGIVSVRARPETIFELSTSSNVIVYISDGLQQDVFEELLERPEGFGNHFDGFVLFDEVSTSSSSTIGAYPAMLTGVPYDGTVGFRRYAEQTIQRDNIGLALHRHGYSIAHVVQSTNLFFQPEHTVNPFLFTKKLEADDLSSRTLLDASLFRHTPHFLKPFVFDGRSGTAARILGLPSALSSINETTAYADFMELVDRRMKLGSAAPAFRLYHLLNAHPPLSLNEECRYEQMARFREDYVRTNVCSMKMFVRFLAKLKELGVYDNSHIIFLGDHGCRGERTGIAPIVTGLNTGDAWPAVAIKPAGRRGPIEVLHQQAEIADIAATIVALTGIEATFPGRPLFSLREDEDRERHFFLGKPGERWDKSSDQAPNGTYFVIRGPVRDPGSWTVVRSKLDG